MVDGNCLLTNVIYRATVITSENSKQYVGLNCRVIKFIVKRRYAQHIYSFDNRKSIHKATLLR